VAAPQEDEKIPPRDKRIVRHIKALSEAGTDIKKFIDALHAFRDDSSLTTGQRDAIFKTMAHDAAQAYYVIVTGKPIEFDEEDPDKKPQNKP
jgi:hypothetical protein